MMELKELVGNDNIVRFERYFDGNLWYRVYTYDSSEDDCYRAIGDEFPVPIVDIGSATFQAEDKAILFMRYIRAHLRLLESAKKEQNG